MCDYLGVSQCKYLTMPDHKGKAEILRNSMQNTLIVFYYFIILLTIIDIHMTLYLYFY